MWHNVVHISARLNLIDALGASQSDVFWELKQGTPVKNVSHAAATLSPVVAVVHPPGEEERNPCPGDKVWAQFRGVQRCFTLVKEYERAHAFRYDYFIRVRPDLLWLRRMPDIRYFSEKKPSMVIIFRDFFWIVPRSQAEPLVDGSVQCGSKDTTMETILNIRLKSLQARVGFQCWDRVWCAHNMGPGWTGGSPEWEHWAVLPFATLTREVQNSACPDLSTGQWGCPSRSPGCVGIECMGEARALERVQAWHTQPALVEDPSCVALLDNPGGRATEEAMDRASTCQAQKRPEVP